MVSLSFVQPYYVKTYNTINSAGIFAMNDVQIGRVVPKDKIDIIKNEIIRVAETLLDSTGVESVTTKFNNVITELYKNTDTPTDPLPIQKVGYAISQASTEGAQQFIKINPGITQQGFKQFNDTLFSSPNAKEIYTEMK